MAYTCQIHPEPSWAASAAVVVLSAQSRLADRKRHSPQVSPSAMTAPDRENQMLPGQYVARC